jgi:hypothetical protein
MQMAAFSWTTGTSGLWSTATNWTPGTVPNDPAATVTIDAVPVPAGGAYIVTLAAGTTDTVASLTMNGANNLKGSNSSPYNAAELELDGTLAFAALAGPAGTAGRLNGSLQTFMHTANGNNAEMINAGTVDAFIQVEGNLLITGTNGFYATNYVQALAGTVTVDTAAINEMTGNVLFDGIFEAKGPNSAVKLGGALQHLVVNIGTVEGPPLVPGGWTELTFNDPTAAITEWNGTAYVSVESTLTDIRSGGTVDVLAARNYTSAIPLTLEAGNPAAPGPGMLNLQAGTVTTAGININAGIVQGFGTIVGPVANNGTLIALGGDLNLTGALTGTGVVKFDTDVKSGGTINPVGARLDVTSVAAGETITMNGDNILVLNTPAAFAGSIAAKVGDRIVLTGITAASAVDTNGTLVVSNAAGATVASLALSGSFVNDRFDVSGSNITVAAVGSPPTPTPTPLPTPGAGHFTIIDTTTGAALPDTSTAYPGPVAGIQWQFITSTTDSLAITATSPNTFIHTGSGTDAINVSKVNGTNVLDGSTGSNFLVGGTGFDTFFVDDRSPAADVFSTVVGFHSGDNATIFGVTATDFKLNTLDNQGAAGFQGLDFGFSAAGKANANLVLSGFTTADLTNGRLTTTFGTNAATASAPASTFMLIHAN